MNKIKLDLGNEEFIHEVLPNGLEVYIHSNPCNEGYYLTLNTKYGSLYKKFKHVSEKDYNETPDGVAHFLEHLTFKTPDGDASEIFPTLGSNGNAYTSTDVTCYEIWGHDNYEDNLNFLLDFVQTPFYNEELVENERGIIAEEVKMYEDHPDRRINNLVNQAIYHKDRRKNLVAGNLEDVSKISLEDITKAYDYFYEPSNMFVIITGNIDVDKILEIIKNNQEAKNIAKKEEVIREDEIEPDTVPVPKKTYKEQIEIDRGYFIIKLPLSKFKDCSKNEIAVYYNTLLTIHFGETSILREKLINERLITTGIYATPVITDDHVLIFTEVESEHIEETLKYIKEEFKHFDVSEEEINRKKKLMIRAYITLFDNMYRVNDFIRKGILRNNEVITNCLELYNSVNPKTAKFFINAIDLSNTSELIFKSDKK